MPILLRLKQKGSHVDCFIVNGATSTWGAVSDGKVVTVTTFPFQYVVKYTRRPLTVFRSNSKFEQNLQCSGLKYAQLLTAKFCARHNNVTSWRMQNFVVIGQICDEQEGVKSTAKFHRISNSIEISLVGRHRCDVLFSEFE